MGSTLSFLSFVSFVQFIFFIFTIIFMVLVASRLHRILEEMEALNRSIFRIGHPEIPWPPITPGLVVHEEWRDGVPWRMRADGGWEVKRGWRWKAAATEQRREAS